jgi:flagellar protein FlbD
VIPLTLLDGKPIVVNVDLVQWIEETPDTVITLTSGERLLVKERSDEVVRRAVEFKRAVIAGPAVVAAADADTAEY